MVQVPSNWGKQNSPSLVSCTQTIRYISSSVTFFTATTNLTVPASPYVQQTVTIATPFHDDPCARCLTITVITDATAATHTGTLRITGTNQWGATVTEDVSWSQAASLTRAYFTLWAYKTLTSVVMVAAGGGTSGTTTDSVSVGIAATTGVAGTAGTQINGASATRFAGAGLMLPVKNTLTAAAPTAATCEVTGVSFTGANVAVAMSRAAGHLIDALYAVIVPAETLVLSGAGIYGLELHIQTNRGE